jgi:hypothetical protein
MVDWSFGVDCSRAEAWNLMGRDDAMAALTAKVLILFSDMMYVCVLCVMSRKVRVTSVESCIIAESADLVLRKPRFNTVEQAHCLTRHKVTGNTLLFRVFMVRILGSRTLK